MGAIEQGTTPPLAGSVLPPGELKQKTRDAEAALARQAFETDRKAEEARKEVEEAFKARQVRPDAIERVNAAVRRAAEARKNEIELFRFPASFCTDGGRRINNNERDWPDSLDGFAKRAYEAYVQHFKPHGYRLKAQVMDFPNGSPGDGALFLGWRSASFLLG